MGAKVSRKKKEQQPGSQLTQVALVPMITCQLCGSQISNNEYHHHLIQCQEQQLLEQELAISHILEEQWAQTHLKQMVTGTIDVKVPLDFTLSTFQWRKVEINPKYNEYSKESIDFIKKQDFVVRYVWFRHQMIRLSSTPDKEVKTFKINQNNLIESSLKVMKDSEPSWDIKIRLNEEEAFDAGGVTREWLSMLERDLCRQLLHKCQTEEPLLKLRSMGVGQYQKDIELVDRFRLFGFMLTRFLIENIPMESRLCWPLLRQLFKADTPFQLHDIYHYDQQLYRSLKYMRQQVLNEEQLDLYFTYESEKGSQELFEGGANEKVNNGNKQFYISFLIRHMFERKEHVYIHAIRSELLRYIPKDILAIFQPYQLEMILNGKPSISIKEWKQNTEYKGEYHPEHQNVLWFWQTLQTFNQEQLSKLMKYVSGSTRLNLQGFEKMTSNQGKGNKFQLVSSTYEKHNPYPRGITCFNRLVLPLYEDQLMQHYYLGIIVNSNFQGVFGLD